MLNNFNIQGSILLAAFTLLANLLSAQVIDEPTTATTIHQQNDTSNGNVNGFLRAELVADRNVGRNWLLILLVTVGPAIAFLLAVGLITLFICIRNRQRRNAFKEKPMENVSDEEEGEILNDLEAKPAVKTAIALADEEDKEKAKTPPTESESEELPASVESRYVDDEMNKQQNGSVPSTKSHTTSLVEKKEMMLMTATEA